MYLKSCMFRHFAVAAVCQLCAVMMVACKTKRSDQSTYAEAYLFSRAAECVSGMENISRDYNNMVANAVFCSQKCPDMHKDDFDQYGYATLDRYACRAKCQRKLLDVPDTPQRVIEFADEISYDSLRLCTEQANISNQPGKGKHGSEGAYPGYHPSSVFLQKNHTNHTVICEQVEEIVSSLFGSLEECRAACEDNNLPSDPRKRFTLPFTRYAISELECKTGCLLWLEHFNGTHHPRLLSAAYENLQICYYYSNRLQGASWNTKPSLYPKDLDVLVKKAFDDQRQRIQREWYFLRREVLQYLKPLQEERNKLMKLRALLKEQLLQARADLGETDLGKGITITRDEAKLKGTSRFEAEGFVSQEECDMLFQMGRNLTVRGNGYDGKEQPFSKFELFKGFSPEMAAQLIASGQLKPEAPRVLLKLAERVRAYIKAYFQLERELYYSYTHLACREALPGAQEGRNDMSHPVHGDNCNFEKNTGRCTKESPAYTWRDYSSVVFLNGDIEGGEFIFGRSMHDRDATVVPKCGRAVGFASENLHGVLALRKGERCILALWLTFDPQHEEGGLTDAAKVIYREQREEA
ncbi:prolyl 3-hydroxylase 1-like isoform X2 [Ornithodoros turicata]|uniref:prolyl 3-hydroxylase 1-like isoform X2 n=1 Tax=Ornithodoros turicata TaxID=34597 RepID=UPI0031390677